MSERRESPSASKRCSASRASLDETASSPKAAIARRSSRESRPAAVGEARC